MSDRGVSEVLGFVLVFALVTGTIGVVYATSITGLYDIQQAEKVDNVERAFDVLADNLEDLYRTGTPSRATEIKLAGGSLRTGEEVRIDVEAAEVGNLTNNATYGVTTRPIVYEDEGGTKLVYASGAVIRTSDAGAVMLGDPDWINGTSRSAIPLVKTYGSGGVSGEGSVLVVAQSGSRSLRDPFVVPPGSTVGVNVTVTSPRAVVWKRYFEAQGYEPIDADLANGNVTYRFETQELYVSRTSVEVTFDR